MLISITIAISVMIVMVIVLMALVILYHSTRIFLVQSPTFAVFARGAGFGFGVELSASLP